MKRCEVIKFKLIPVPKLCECYSYILEIHSQSGIWIRPFLTFMQKGCGVKSASPCSPFIMTTVNVFPHPADSTESSSSTFCSLDRQTVQQTDRHLQWAANSFSGRRFARSVQSCIIILPARSSTSLRLHSMPTEFCSRPRSNRFPLIQVSLSNIFPLWWRHVEE